MCVVCVVRASLALSRRTENAEHDELEKENSRHEEMVDDGPHGA